MSQAQWKQLAAKINALSLRERVLVFVAVAFLLASLVDAFLLTPLLNQQKRLAAQVVQQQEKIKEAQAQLDAVIEARSGASSSPEAKRLAALRAELTQAEDKLQQNREKLVEPGHMAELMRQMLSRNTNLQLMKLETLPVEPLVAVEESTAGAKQKSETQPGKQLWKHGVRITVRGNYLELLQYLQGLERLPSQMIWNQARLEVGQYPAADLTITLYTLSLDKAWLQI